MREIINIKKLMQLNFEDEGKGLVVKLQEIGALPSSFNCPRCGTLMNVSIF